MHKEHNTVCLFPTLGSPYFQTRMGYSFYVWETAGG